jgi:glycerol kinase
MKKCIFCLLNYMQKCILSLDQGTTSSRAIVYDENAKRILIENKEFKQYFPQNAWVEHDPEEIWESQLNVTTKAITKAKEKGFTVEAIGITNQRETSIVWNRKTGKAVYNAIVWQDRRTADYCLKLKNEGKQDFIYSKTGLVIDAYFSASKIAWILDNVDGAREMAEKGDLAFGTIDTWLCWKLSAGKLHVSDVSNASRTMLYNIHDLSWDNELLALFNIPKSMLPTVVDSSGIVGYTDAALFSCEIPIAGIAGDQQAALFGQLCVEKGMLKCTYGTGCFLMMNTGSDAVHSKSNLLTTIAWKMGSEIQYALEGSVFIGGAVIQWLRDKLEFFAEAADSEALAEAAEDNGGVYFVPALAGLGAPHWDPFARGSIFGITRATTKAHFTRAALESIGFQVNDLINAIAADFPTKLNELRVDGGASANNLLLQFQADISKLAIVRSSNQESTAIGVAFLAGIGCGMWTKESLVKKWKSDLKFEPDMDEHTRGKTLIMWEKAIGRSLKWES